VNLFNAYTNINQQVHNDTGFNFANNSNNYLNSKQDKDILEQQLKSLLVCFRNSSKLLFNFVLVQSEMKPTQLKIFFADQQFISMIQSLITLNHDLYVG
jgi:hypothetical protein